MLSLRLEPRTQRMQETEITMEYSSQINKLFKIKGKGKSKDDRVEELNDKIDCLQRAIANLTRLVAEGRLS